MATAKLRRNTHFDYKKSYLQIKNEFSNRCVDSPATHDSLHKKVGLWPCHNQGGNQVNVNSIK